MRSTILSRSPPLLHFMQLSNSRPSLCFFSDQGKVLEDEQRARENVYVKVLCLFECVWLFILESLFDDWLIAVFVVVLVQKMEKEKLEKQKQKLEEKEKTEKEKADAKVL